MLREQNIQDGGLAPIRYFCFPAALPLVTAFFSKDRGAATKLYNDSWLQSDLALHFHLHGVHVKGLHPPPRLTSTFAGTAAANDGVGRAHRAGWVPTSPGHLRWHCGIQRSSWITGNDKVPNKLFLGINRQASRPTMPRPRLQVKVTYACRCRSAGTVGTALSRLCVWPRHIRTGSDARVADTTTIRRREFR